MKITCIVIEDEPLAMERTVSYIKKMPVLELVNTFDNAMDAYEFLRSEKVDLLFLDINLGELSGIQLLESVQIDSDVIITTAYPDFALKGYDLDVTDYLLKPFVFDRFFQAVDKVVQSRQSKEQAGSRDFFFVKTANRLEKIFFNELLFIEGMRDYRKIHTTTKKIMTLQTFGEFEKEISPSILCRVHKSWMVAVNKIEAIEKDTILIREQQIPISDTYRQHLYEIIGK